MKLTLEIARRCSKEGFLDLNEYEAEVTSIADEATEFLSQKIDHRQYGQNHFRVQTLMAARKTKPMKVSPRLS